MDRIRQTFGVLRGNSSKLRYGVAISAVVFVSLLVAVMRPAYAAPNDVIINEIMYNPSSGNEMDEYLELYNTTASPIDLEGWSFSAGITLTFSAGVTIPANGYIIISPNSTQTQSTYSLTPDAVYTGALSNGGEAITLQDDSATTINSVTYDDAAPWPTSPDGGGPSLELKDPNSDNTVATNWGASVGGPTPKAENSYLNLSLPEVTNVNDPNGIDANEVVTITANVQDADTVELKYVVNFDTEQTVTMLDDGNSGDGAAGDDVYGADIPGQQLSDLIRFKVEATNGDGMSSAPSVDDSINYYGYTINDDSITSAAPILNWYISDADYQDMYDNFETPNDYPAVFSYGDDVYDNSTVNIKGSNSRYFTKKSIKVDLPSGHYLNMPGLATDIDKFHLNANFRAANAARVSTLWWAVEQAGVPAPETVLTQVQRNGEFEGSYLLIDKYKSSWRQQNGFDNGQMIEDSFTVESGPEDLTNYNNWRASLNDTDRKDPTRREHVLDDNNIPALINYMAIMAIIHQHDYSANQNIFYYRDNETSRWQTLVWDLDLALMPFSPRTLANSRDIYQQHLSAKRFFLDAIMDQPELKEAYYRRLATLSEKFYSDDTLLNKYNELTDTYADLSEADEIKWPSDESATRSSVDEDRKSIATIKKALTQYLVEPWAIPAAQTDAERQSVQIAEVAPSVTDGNEYIRLYNDADTAVDISNWEIEGINYVIPAGSVIPSKGSVYLVKKDSDYKSTHSPVYIIGQYGNDLGDSGGNQTLLTDQGAEIDSYDY